MRHMLQIDNLALITDRQVNGVFRHAFVTNLVINDCALSTQSKERSYLLPLFFSGEDSENGKLFVEDSVNVNISDAFVEALRVVLEGFESKPTTKFAYIYAVLSAPTYRTRYNDFLKRDFPRIPLPDNAARFQQLAGLGQQLIDLHLLRQTLPPITGYPKAGSNRVDKIEFVPDPEAPHQGHVWINAGQYFESMPGQVWEYTIGGYQVAHKWLKDRKGRLLTFDELQHYSRVIAALNETIRLQDQIDEVIGSWPLVTAKVR
jgi:predicted helicase